MPRRASTAAVSQLNVAKAQLAQTQFRIDELKITLSNTDLELPDRRVREPAQLWIRARSPAATPSFCPSSTSAGAHGGESRRKGLPQSDTGVAAEVTVDAFPGEEFTGQVSRVAPVFDPATRTAQMEIEVPNPGFRLKPGMYARVRLTVERRPDALTVPRNAVVDMDGKRGVFLVSERPRGSSRSRRACPTANASRFWTASRTASA